MRDFKHDKGFHITNREAPCKSCSRFVSSKNKVELESSSTLIIKCRFQKLDINAFVYQRTGTKWMPFFGPLVGLVLGSETPETNCPKHQTKRLKSYFVPDMHYYFQYESMAYSIIHYWHHAKFTNGCRMTI